MSSSRPSSYVFAQPGPLRLYSTSELLKLPAPTWLIDGIVPAGGLIGLYGQPGHGKSFLTIDMALCVATGHPWQGHPVKRGSVLYVSAEGGTGIGKRVHAWLDYHQIPPGQAKVAWLTESIPVTSNSTEMDILLSRINDELEWMPNLVVIDTLARCFDGDENQQEDMGRFIQGVDRMRLEFQSSVIVVHHTRLDAERERGSTAFRGAADCMLSLHKNDRGLMTLECNKQKDSEEFRNMRLDLVVRPQFDSCIIRYEPSAEERLLQFLHQKSAMSFSEGWAHVHTKMSKATYKRALVSLRQSGKILKESDYYVLSEGE